MSIVTVSLDVKTKKIWDKLPYQEKSAMVRTWLLSLDPTTKKEPESNAEQIKKLLTLEPFHEQPHKKGDSGRATQASYVLANIMTNQKKMPSRYTTQQNENRLYSLYNYANGSLSA